MTTPNPATLTLRFLPPLPLISRLRDVDEKPKDESHENHRTRVHAEHR
jgi:hypothetical protein